MFGALAGLKKWVPGHQPGVCTLSRPSDLGGAAWWAGLLGLRLAFPVALSVARAGSELDCFEC